MVICYLDKWLHTLFHFSLHTLAFFRPSLTGLVRVIETRFQNGDLKFIPSPADKWWAMTRSRRVFDVLLCPECLGHHSSRCRFALAGWAQWIPEMHSLIMHIVWQPISHDLTIWTLLESHCLHQKSHGFILWVFGSGFLWESCIKQSIRPFHTFPIVVMFSHYL